MTIIKMCPSGYAFATILLLTCAQSQGEESDVAAYIKLLSDANPTARRLATEALGRLGPRAKEAVPALRKGLDDPEARVKVATVEALKKIEAVKKKGPLVIKGFGLAHHVITFSPDGKHIAAGGNKSVVVFDVEAERVVRKFEGFASSAYDVKFSPDGKYLAATDEWSVRLWKWEADEEPILLNTESKAIVTCLAFNSDGTRIAAASKDRILRIWNVEKRKVVHESKSPLAGTDNVTATHHHGTVAFSRDDQFLAVTWDGLTMLLDGKTGEIKHNLKRSGYAAFNPDGTRLALSHKSVTIYDTATGTVVLTIDAEYASGVAYSPDGKMLWAGSFFWNPRTGERLPTSLGGAPGNLRVDGPRQIFSPKGNRFAKYTSDGSIAVWDLP